MILVITSVHQSIIPYPMFLIIYFGMYEFSNLDMKTPDTDKYNEESSAIRNIILPKKIIHLLIFLYFTKMYEIK